MIFKFLVECFFLKNRKKSDSKKISIVKVFCSWVELFVTVCTKTALKIALKKLFFGVFFQKNCFYFFHFSPQNDALK